MTKTFCPLPWVGLSTRNNGYYRVCCHSTSGKDKGFLKKEDSDFMRAGEVSLDEVRNSDTIKEMRTKMLAGVWPEQCIRCKKEEESGIFSFRQRIKKDLELEFNLAKAKEVTGSQGELELSQSKLKIIDFRYGNKCNLKCRMCAASDSSAWYDDHVKMFQPKIFDMPKAAILKKSPTGKWVVEGDHFSWYESSRFQKDLKNNVTEISRVQMAGGEPFLIKEFTTLIEELVRSKRSKDIVLDYVTNLTVLPEGLVKLWKEFKKIYICVSIDGVGVANEYIRPPSRWDKMMPLMKKLNDLPVPMFLSFAVTVQIYNIFRLTDIFDWKINSGLDNFNRVRSSPVVGPHVLHGPSYLNIKALPSELKSQVVERFSTYLENFDKESVRHTNASGQEVYDWIQKSLESYAKYMNSEDWSEEFQRFVSYTKNLDDVRGESFVKINPEFAKYF